MSRRILWCSSDELGRATDPEEGGALGVAVLEAFQNAGAFTLASTHLMAMKVYGASTKGVRNGSMGFDDATLEPTYELRLGAPGKSAGLDIASRLGLDPHLISVARSRMTNVERDVSRFLAELHDRIDVLERERTELTARTAAIEAREKSLEQTWEKKYAAKIRELEQRASELTAQFEQSRRRKPSASSARKPTSKSRRPNASSRKPSRPWRPCPRPLHLA